MAAKKREFLQDVFSEVPSTYERINHILTLGLDRLWRKRAATIATTASAGRWADMCTGTAEMAAKLKSLAPGGTSVCAFDFSLPMIQNAVLKSDTNGIRFTATNVRSLPLPPESIDLITMSFATRNINLSREVLTETFTEYHRVLKPGALFVNLETSMPPSALIRLFFKLYIKLFVKPIGSRISGSKKGYAYLAKTIPRFYTAEVLANIMRDAGFSDVRIHPQLFGVAAIHEARR